MSDGIEKKVTRVSIIIPILFVGLLFLIYLLDVSMGKHFFRFGIYPRTLEGLRGIFFMPFLHGSFSHLLSNSIPLLLLGFLLIYSYRYIAYPVFFMLWFIDGLGVWFFGRESYHIGASGLVYGMASFLFFSGLLRKNRNLLGLSLAVVFIYGGLVWGLFPILPDISWEGHLFGFLAGIALSLYYQKKGPPDDPVPEWMEEEPGEEIDWTEVKKPEM